MSVGAWGAGIFENDAALDWLSDLIDADSLQEGRYLLERVVSLGRNEYLEVDTASAALAAAAIVAALHDGRSDGLPEDARDWLEEHREAVDRAFRELALNAVKRVAEDSELRDLWSEGGPTNPEWLATVDGLVARLAS